MRIIAGKFARRKLFAPKGLLTRPTTNRTRESLFHLAENRREFTGASVLDLFAGAGTIGFEALSRGARSVVFVEKEGRVLQVARRNARKLDVEDQCIFLRADAVRYLRRYKGPAFDFIFADPPYSLEAMPEMPSLALPHTAEGGLFILEHDRRIFFDREPAHPDLDVSRSYGRTVVSVFRRAQAVVPDPAAAEHASRPVFS